MQASLFGLKDPIFCVDPAAAGQLIDKLPFLKVPGCSAG
jgi:hypothetical protein